MPIPSNLGTWTLRNMLFLFDAILNLSTLVGHHGRLKSTVDMRSLNLGALPWTSTSPKTSDSRDFGFPRPQMTGRGNVLWMLRLSSLLDAPSGFSRCSWGVQVGIQVYELRSLFLVRPKEMDPTYGI